MDYAEFLSLEVDYPQADYRFWSFLPSAETERHLARQRLRIRFSGGRFSAWGLDTLDRTASQDTFLDFYLFCADPYFIRAGEVPIIRPGQELLLFQPKVKQKPETAGGTVAQVIQYTDFQRKEVAEGRKKYFGSTFGPPPVAVFRLPFPCQQETIQLRVAVPPRRVFWAYAICPKPSLSLHVHADQAFKRFEEANTADSVTFISEEAFPLTSLALRSATLVVEDGQGQFLPLIENLAAPRLDRLVWDEGRRNYIGTVNLDLQHFGVVS